MSKELAQFTLDESGQTFLVEVETPPGAPPSSIRRVAVGDTAARALEASQTLEKALEQVKPVVNKVVDRLKDGLTSPADEVAVTFGLNLNTEVGVVFGSVGGGVTFEVTMTWTRDTNDQGE
jgi:hypothetical protein